MDIQGERSRRRGRETEGQKEREDSTKTGARSEVMILQGILI